MSADTPVNQAFEEARNARHKIEVVKPIKLDRNGVRDVLTEAIAEDFEQVYVIGFKNKQAHFKGSKLDSNMEIIGALEMCKMQIYEQSGS